VSLLALAVSGRGLVDPEQPVVYADDEAFLRGRGAFETLRIYGGRPFELRQHLGRLSESAGRLGLPPPELQEIESLVSAAIEEAAAEEAVLRLYATPGRADGGGPFAIVLVAALPADLEEQRARGLRTISVEFRPSDLIGGVKSTSYALNMVAVDQAKARGADDAVFLAGDETVLEATTSNLWWRRGRTLYTPSLHLGILARRDPGGADQDGACARFRGGGRDLPRAGARGRRGGLHVVLGPGGDARRRARRAVDRGRSSRRRDP